MLSTEELAKYKERLELANKKEAEKAEILTTARNKNAQALEILKTYGYESSKDVPKLVADLEELEAKIRKTDTEAEAEIIKINETKQKLDQIIAS